MKATSSKSVIKGTALVHLNFVLTGMVMTLLGPMLPILAARWALNDQQAGYLFTGQFVTSVGGVLLSSVLVRRYGYRLTLIYGLILMGLGIAALVRAPWPLGLAAVCLYGAGTGLNTPAANLFVSDANPHKRAAALNLLNSSWGVGAMVCPFLVAAAQRSQRVPFLLYGIAGGLAIVAVWMALVRFRAEMPLAQQAASVEAASVWRNRFIPVVAVLLFIYVGTENSVGGWVASYAKRIDPAAVTVWAMIPSMFWGALLVGRALAPVFLRHLAETGLARASLAMALAGIITLLSARTVDAVILGAAMAGLGLAPIYPTSISLMPRWFGASTAQVAGLLFAVGNAGGGVLPWFVGMVSKHLDSLRAGFFVPLAGAGLMLSFYLLHKVPESRK